MVKECEQLNAEWERLTHFFKREEMSAKTVLLKEGHFCLPRVFCNDERSYFRLKQLNRVHSIH